jgi:[histone H4]-N-methyl-L-lysine20 N-methyltransferase
VPQILLHKVIIAKDVEDAEKALLNLAGIRRYLGALRTEPEKKDFRNHLRKYVNMYLPDCPYEVSTTNRYTVTAHEASVTARKRIREGDKIKYLCGTLVPLTDAELKDLDLTQRNFSIVQSDRKKNTLIFLGPARFANHDCAANGRLVSVGKDGLEVHATRNIDIGEEITVTYSLGYFGSNNEECLCHTCELQARNGWTSTDAFGAPQSGESTPIPTEAFPGSPYSFRKKRKNGPVSGSTSGAPSPSPPKKQKLDRPPSRLNQVSTPPPNLLSPEEESAPATAPQSKDSSERCILEQFGRSKKRTLNDRVAEDASIDGTNQDTPADPPKKKRMRLIDQMASSAGSSPEILTRSRPSSSLSDDSGNDSLSSKTSSHSTQATSISEALVNIKVENSEVAKIERDGALSHIRRTSMNSPKVQSNYTNAESARTTPKPTHVSLTTNAASAVIPSIEDPTFDIKNPSAVTTTKPTTTTLTVLPDPASLPTIRTPGDYILTPRLLALPHDRWVQCQTCRNYFLQDNGYQTRRECPRCERHSKLYGFGWPKTEPDPRRLREVKEAREREEKKAGKGRKKRRSGEGDTIVVETAKGPTGRQRAGQRLASASRGGKGGGVWGRGGKGGGRSGRSGKGTWVEGGGEDEREERVMDHRTVNRFIAPEEEREAKKRGKIPRLEIVNGITRPTTTGLVTDSSSATPDRNLARLGGSVFAERSGSASRDNTSAREESVASAGFEEVDGALRRSKRYFGSRMTM